MTSNTHNSESPSPDAPNGAAEAAAGAQGVGAVSGAVPGPAGIGAMPGAPGAGAVPGPIGVGATSAVGAGDDKAAGASGAEGQPKTMADLKPWKGKATRVDKVLLTMIFVVPAFYLAMMPLRPFMIANQPILLEFLTGAKTAIVGAAAYARVGELPLWLVVFAGFVGMAKFDWLFWLAGYRWGDGILNIFTSTERQRRQVERFRKLPSWLLFLLVAVSRMPGVPGTLIWLVAGWNRMKLWQFLLADFITCMLLTVGVAALGFSLGQAAVDVIQTVDRYALWISLVLIVGVAVWSGIRGGKAAAQAQAQAAEKAQG
ncbi:hypothetical protein GCM10022261_08680 [Brevibacterium daeguense]|uniref:Membrane protein DedA with SNARE-associated domain n=1 Tax=Brevibacterium daeguense TaxID=909936 RepID=A0ABP8EHA2_9MICO|nr:VTT domain-containing protein [Brevibacterium daeguense]